MSDATDIPQADEDDDLDLDLLTEHEKERLKTQAILDQNTRRDHRRRAKINRRRGLPTPKVGDCLHVAIARGIHARNRAGLLFERNRSTKVEIVDGDPATVRARQQRGEAVVDVQGAELILADDALIARQSPAGDEDLLDARATIAAHETEIARLRAELELARAGAKKEARKAAAAASNDVAPARLAAAKAAGKKFDDAQQAQNMFPAGDFAGAPTPGRGAELGDFIAPTSPDKKE